MGTSMCHQFLCIMTVRSERYYCYRVLGETGAIRKDDSNDKKKLVCGYHVSLFACKVSAASGGSVTQLP